MPNEKEVAILAMQIGGGSGGGGASGAWEPAPPPKSITEEIHDIAFGKPGEAPPTFAPGKPVTADDLAARPGESVQDQISRISFGEIGSKPTRGTKSAIDGLTKAFSGLGDAPKSGKSTKAAEAGPARAEKSQAASKADRSK